MKKYNSTRSLSEYDEDIFWTDDITVCELTSSDVDKAEKEFDRYMSKRGAIYDKDPNKMPSVRWFFKLYFGEAEYDIYCGEYWITPDRYICTNKNVADRFMKLVKRLAYHDTYNQVYCDVVQNGKIIDIVCGDY